MRVAVLGTGTMGVGMAHALQRAGHDVVAWNRTPAKAAPLADDGIDVAESVTAAVHGADAVITILFDAESVLDVTTELVAAFGDGAVWLQCSTVGPDGITRIADAAGSDVALLDAPVLGTKQPAEDGKLVPLVSGPTAVVDRARPVLDAIGAKTVVAGDRLGQGSALKLVCNAWVLTITAGAAQSIALASRLGLDPHDFLTAIEGGASDSPYAQLKGGAMIDGQDAASFALDGGRKDLALISAAARDSGLPTDVLAAVSAMYDAASRDGHGDDDLSAVYTAFA